MNNYKDSAEKAASIYSQVVDTTLKNAKVGDYVYYGTYPQSKAGTDNTGIEWLVLAKEGDKVLLLSRYGLDTQPYNTEYMDVTWETCSLRKWLNNDFLNKAFTAEEQKVIATTNVSNARNQGCWDTNGGNDTRDKIFLLSYAEADKYLGVNSENTKARVAPTEYAEVQGAGINSSYTTSDGKEAGYWWLRSPGTYQNYAASVNYDGSLYFDYVNYDDYCVRPAFWLNLEEMRFADPTPCSLDGEIEAYIRRLEQEMQEEDVEKLLTLLNRRKSLVKAEKYNDALALMNSGKYEEAIAAFEALDGYKDSEEQITACETAIKDIAYDAAVALMNSGNIEKAISEFRALGDFKDSTEKVVKLESQVKVGDYVKYGTYPQTMEETDNTGIEWLVLAKEGNKVLLLSRYGLDAQPYNTEDTDVTWETCSLRKWLNNDFLNKAFTAEEQKAIATTNVSNAKNQGYYSTNGGKDTQDKIFLLSYAEANKYLGVTYDNSNNTKARVAPTLYALVQGAFTSTSYTTAEGKAAGWWWLRCPGLDQSSAARVHIDGSLSDDYVNSDNYCARPAFWLNLES